MHRIINTGGYGQFNKMLEKATSHLLLETDWETMLSICDLIRQGDVQPKHAVQSIHKKIVNDNPHTALYALSVLECCVKNCGALIHDEVCTKQYMEQLKEVAKTSQQEDVKNKILELIQAWAFAFRESPKYRAVQDTLRIMKAENFDFPALKESDAMFDASIAPEWKEGDNCHRCRAAFTTFNRKHHCRACGQVFCHQCSSKNSTLPKYGIEKEVRVCNTCYEQINKPSTTTPKETDLPAHYLTSSLAQQQQVPPRKSEDELREEEELQMALALSQSEAEHKEQEKKRVTSAIILNSSTFAKDNYSPPPSPDPSPSKDEEIEEVDPELAKYLDRQYWEQRQSALGEQTSRVNVTSPSAPNISSPMPQKIVTIKQQNGEVDNEMDSFVKKLRSQVEIFVNRMKSNSSRGRSIANDTSVQNLFMNITQMHSELLRYIRSQEDKRVYYEGLQDKLTQIKDGRGALDALREEHRERIFREKQEADRLKQIQMAQKLEIMRKKKQEYFEYQRELALRKVQEEERELQMRQEIQKQQYKMGGYQSVANYIGAMPNQGSPVRHTQYQNDYSNSMSTGTQAVYSYPHPTMVHYPAPNYMMQQHHQNLHHHQPQQLQQPSPMMDSNITPKQDISINDSMIQQSQHYNPEHMQESLGQVTVSGPGMISQIPGVVPPSQIQAPNPNVVIVPREIVTPLPLGVPQNSVHAVPQSMVQVRPMTGNLQDQMLPNQQQVMMNQVPSGVQRQMSLPQNHQGQISNHQGQIPSHQNQINNHQTQMPNNQGQIPNHQNLIPNHQNQLPNHQNQISNHQAQIPNHQVQIPNQQMQQQNINHPQGANISIPGHMSMPHMNNGSIVGTQPMQGMSDINNIPASQAPQVLSIGQHMQYHQVHQQPQPIQIVQVQQPPIEQKEERKSPEVAELISFD